MNSIGSKFCQMGSTCVDSIMSQYSEKANHYSLESHAQPRYPRVNPPGGRWHSNKSINLSRPLPTEARNEGGCLVCLTLGAAGGANTVIRVVERPSSQPEGVRQTYSSCPALYRRKSSMLTRALIPHFMIVLLEFTLKPSLGISSDDS